jgi:hypothetical protein
LDVSIEILYSGLITLLSGLNFPVLGDLHCGHAVFSFLELFLDIRTADVMAGDLVSDGVLQGLLDGLVGSLVGADEFNVHLLYRDDLFSETLDLSFSEVLNEFLIVLQDLLLLSIELFSVLGIVLVFKLLNLSEGVFCGEGVLWTLCKEFGDDDVSHGP